MALHRVMVARSRYSGGSNASGPGPGTHEPVDMKMLMTHDGSAILPNASWDFYDGQTSVVIDPEKGSSLQLEMSPFTTPSSGTAHITAGNANANRCMNAFAATKFYITWLEWLSLGWIGNDQAGGGKDLWMFFPYKNSDESWLVDFDNATSGDSTEWVNGPVRWHFDFSNIIGLEGNSFANTHAIASLPGTGAPGDPGDIRPRGTWVRCEVLVTLPSPSTPDGEAQMWIGGVAYPKTGMPSVNVVTGLHMTGLRHDSDRGLRLGRISLVNTWGGGGFVHAAVNQNRYKNLYVSGGYARSGEEPNHWVISLAAGATSTPAAGTDVELIAQLVDGNGNPVDIIGRALWPSANLTGPATIVKHADPAGSPYTAEERGKVLFTVSVSIGATTGQDIAVTCDDYARLSNDTVNGTHRMSNTFHLTVS